jgi:hypothetical protein
MHAVETSSDAIETNNDAVETNSEAVEPPTDLQSETDDFQVTDPADEANETALLFIPKDIVYSTEVHQTAKHETTPNPAAYFSLNGKCYGIPSDCTLVWEDNIKSPRVNAILTQGEESFRGSMSLRGRIKRDSNVTVNPLQQATYVFAIDVSLIDVTEITIQKPGEFEMPDYFMAPETWSPANIGMLTFTTAAARFSNPVVPQLLDAEAETKLKQLTQDFANINKSGGVFQFEILVDYYTDEEDDIDPLFEQTKWKWARDRTEDPLRDWIANSPNLLELKQNNIHGPQARPPLSNQHLVLGLRRGHRDMLDMKIVLVYGFHLEHQYTVGLAAEIAATSIRAALASVDGSAFSTNSYDNNQPKLVRASIAWPDTIDRPKLGDRFDVQLPFEVPDVPIYNDPPYIRPTVAQQFHDDPNQEVAGGEIIIAGETAEEKEDRSEEHRLAYLNSQRKIWKGYYFGADDLTIPGEITLHLERPPDGLWEGPPELQPYVSTVVPAHKKDLSTTDYLAFVKNEAPRHNVTVTPIMSDQTYRDVIRCFAEFAKLADSDQAATRLSDHMASFALAGDLDLPFPTRNFLYGIEPPIVKCFLQSFTAYQKTRFLNTVRKVEHGIVLFEGCPAAGKTMAMEICALLWNCRDEQQFLWITDTNEAVNEAAARVAARAKAAKMTDRLYIRIHSLEAEIRKFHAYYVTALSEVKPHFDSVRQTTHDAALTIDIIGQGHQDRKKDKRWSEATRDLDLCQALIWYCKTYKTEEIVLDLLSKLRNQNKYKDPKDKEPIKALTTAIIERLFLKADGVFATCAIALQTKVHNYFRPGLILKDEDAKSVPLYTFSLFGVYNPFFIVLGGDTKQKLPFLPTAMQVDVVNHFAKFCLYPTLQRFKEAGIAVHPFYQQHRMWHQKYVKFISEYFYNTAIIDGNIEKSEPAQVQFLRAFHMKKYNIDSNVIVLSFSDGKVVKEEGGTSLCNKAHIDIFVEYLKDFNATLDRSTSDQLGFDKDNFRTGFLCAYTAQVSLATAASIKNSLQVHASTLESTQGSQFPLTVLNILNYKLSEFAGDRRSNLVGLTRFQYGLVVLINGACVDHETYKFSSRFVLSLKENTRHINAFYDWAVKENIVCDIISPLTCRGCGKLGHIQKDCPDKQAFECYNCGSQDHKASACSVPRSNANIICRRCEQRGHRAVDCPLPYCKQCRTVNHAYEDCPAKRCSKCNVAGHRPDDPVNCPKYQACPKCGGNHSRRHCTVEINRAFLLSATTTASRFDTASIEQRYGVVNPNYTETTETATDDQGVAAGDGEADAGYGATGDGVVTGERGVDGTAVVTWNFDSNVTWCKNAAW